VVGLTGSVVELGENFYCRDVVQLFHYQDSVDRSYLKRTGNVYAYIHSDVFA
jgi:hypothetical protein